MSRSLRTVVRDYRRRPVAVVAAAAPLVVPACFLAATVLVADLGRLVRPFGLLALALVAQVGRLASAPATGVAEALLSGGSFREAVATARAQVVDRVVAATAERALVVVGTVVVGAVVLCVGLGLATVVGYGLSTVGVDAPQGAHTMLLFATLGLIAVGAGVGAPLRLGTSLVGEVSPIRAPVVALSLAGRRPVATTLLIVLRVAPWTMFLLAAAAGVFLATDPPIPTALVGTSILLAVVGTPLAVGLERRVVASASPPADPPAVTSVLPDRRVLLAGIVVLAAVAAPTLAVRIGDERPTTATTAAVPDEATASSIVATADRRTRMTAHYGNETTWEHNTTTGRMERSLSFDWGWDPADRQALLDPDVPGDATVPGLGTQFYGDGTVAFGYDIRYAGPVVRLAAYEAGRWSVVAVPPRRGGMSTAPDVDSRLRGDSVDDEALPWRTLSRGNGTVVVGVERPSRLAPAFGVPAENVSGDSHVRLTVDGDTGRPLVLDVHRNVTEYGEHHRVRSVVRYRGWGTYDLQRPAPLARPSPLELFWDALAY